MEIEIMEDNIDKLYHKTPTVCQKEYIYLNNIKTIDHQDYRLHIITVIQIEIEKNIIRRNNLKKICSNILTVINYTNTILTYSSVAMGAVEIG
jgi:hypothetical protein